MNSMKQCLLWEANSHLSVRNCAPFMKPIGSLHFHKNSRLDPVLSQMNPVHIFIPVPLKSFKYCVHLFSNFVWFWVWNLPLLFSGNTFGMNDNSSPFLNVHIRNSFVSLYSASVLLYLYLFQMFLYVVSKHKGNFTFYLSVSISLFLLFRYSYCPTVT